MKSRDISLVELYTALQNEYLSYYLRKKVYCKEFSVNYNAICLQKKDKIEKISSKNNLPSIFNDEHLKEDYLNKFINEAGIPNLTYKDEVIKKKMQCWDNWYYFTRGTSVKFKRNDRVELGVVLVNDKENCIVSIKDQNGLELDLHYSNVSRLFSEDFFNFN
jgi:hypothetical protein